jgi:hypothetical protein
VGGLRVMLGDAVADSGRSWRRDDRHEMKDVSDG